MNKKNKIVILICTIVVLWLITLIVILSCCRYEYYFDAENKELISVDKLKNKAEVLYVENFQ